MKNSNQRSEEWRSAVSSQQSARERGRDREIAPTRRAVSRRDREIAPSERGRDREIAPTVSSLDGSNLSLLGFSLFRSRRFQPRGRGGPDRILRRGCR